METKTPRTDAVESAWSVRADESAILASKLAVFARTLERENARLRAALEQAEAALDPDSDYVVQEAADCEVTPATVEARILEFVRAALAG